MSKYLWTIHTADEPFSGTSGTVTLGIHGLKAAVYPDATITGKFARNSLDNGLIEVDPDLGDIQTGTLKTTDRTAMWKVDEVRVKSLDSGAEWVADDIGAISDDGEFPLLHFTQSQGPPFIQSGDKPAGGSEDGDSSDESEDSETSNDEPKADESTDDQDEPQGDESEPDKGSEAPTPGENREPPARNPPVKVGQPSPPQAAPGEAASTIDELRRQLSAKDTEIARLRSAELATSYPSVGPPRTFEIFATYQDQTVPVFSVWQDGSLAEGARVFVTDEPQYGFGGAGGRDRFNELFPGVNPTDYGLEFDHPVLSYDGLRFQPVSAKYLRSLFGLDWRNVIYG